MVPKKSKAKYLTNREILSEIHKSKCSFSSFVDTKYSMYDLIVKDLNSINEDTIEQAKIQRAKRIGNELFSTLRAQGNKKVKLVDCVPDIDSFKNSDLVFRIMTFNHIPLNSNRKRVAKTLADNHEKVNFPPFQHWTFDDNDQLICVGKSHWIGGMDNGFFSKDHGSLTETLGLMFMLLSDRYAQRGNWRGYCVDQDTVALTKRGWVNFQSIHENDMILSYHNDHLVWSSIKSIYRDKFYGKMHKLTQFGLDSLVTPRHKLVTDAGLIPIELINDTNEIVLLADKLVNHEKIHDNEVLNQLFYQFVDYHQDDYDNFIKIVMELTTEQQEILFNSCMKLNFCDKTCKFITFTHKNYHILESIQILATLLGKRTMLKKLFFSSNQYRLKILPKESNKMLMKKVNMHGGKQKLKNKLIDQSNILSFNVPTTMYSGYVWCPETEYGCFVAKRNGTVFLTGNTYVDEMKGQAILQLSQVGLQFDESKSENPFSYFTAVVNNSFTRVLNLEKKNQNIRDDLLEDSGYSPSSTRQSQDLFAEENERQAKLYKLIKMPKSSTDDNNDHHDDAADE